MRSLLVPFVLAAALLLSGCVVEETDPNAAPVQSTDAAPWQPPESTASAETVEGAEPKAAPAGAPHADEPQRTDGPVESGMNAQQVPGAWARQAITISNGYGPATLSELATGIAAGSITVQAADRDGYLLEAVLEARAATEDEARAILGRTHLDHSDILEEDTLRLETFVRTETAATPVPVPIQVGTGSSVRATFVFTMPAALAMDLEASAASGDLAAIGLHGPLVDLSTASGDVTVSDLLVTDLVLDSASGLVQADAVVADTLTAMTSSGDVDADRLAVGKVIVSTASGDIDLIGAIDTLEADSSSGDLTIEATPSKSGSFQLASASGDVTLDLPKQGPAYQVDASTASGDIQVNIPDAAVDDEDERHVQATSPGYDDADLQTSVEVSTSSGDITVAAD